MSKSITIEVKNKDVFVKYLKGLNKFTKQAEFNIDNQGCHIYSVNEDKTNRLFYHTNAISCDTQISFAVFDISKLFKSFQICSKYNEDFNLLFDETYIKTNNKLASSFRIQTVNRDSIEKYIKNPLKKELTIVNKVSIISDKLKEILGLLYIDDNNEYNIYFYKKDGIIIADVDNKTLSLSENITIPVQEKEGLIEGDWTETIVLPIESIRNFNLVEANSIDMSYTKEQVIQINAEIDNDNYFIKQKIISCIYEE